MLFQKFKMKLGIACLILLVIIISSDGLRKRSCVRCRNPRLRQTKQKKDNTVIEQLRTIQRKLTEQEATNSRILKLIGDQDGAMSGLARQQDISDLREELRSKTQDLARHVWLLKRKDDALMKKDDELMAKDMQLMDTDSALMNKTDQLMDRDDRLQEQIDANRDKINATKELAAFTVLSATPLDQTELIVLDDGFVRVTYDTEVTDNLGNIDPTTGNFTVPCDGVYLFTTDVIILDFFALSALPFCLQVNGITVVETCAFVLAFLPFSTSVTSTLILEEGDRVSVIIEDYQDFGFEDGTVDGRIRFTGSQITFCH